MHKAVFSKQHSRTVPKAGRLVLFATLSREALPGEGLSTILTSQSHNSRMSHGSSPLTHPLSPAGQTDADNENIVEIGFPLMDVGKLRIIPDKKPIPPEPGMGEMCLRCPHRSRASDTPPKREWDP